MKLVDGVLECRDGHKHEAFMGLVLCESNSRNKGKEILIRAQPAQVTYDGRAYFVCPEDQYHDYAFDAIECGGEVRLVKAGVDHNKTRWVVANCRHLHPEKESFKGIFCDHGVKS